MSQRGRPEVSRTYVSIGIILAFVVGLVFVLIGTSGGIANPTLFFGVGVIFWLVSLGGFLMVSERIRQQDYYGARTPTLVWALGLILLGALVAALFATLSSVFFLLSFGGIVAGILFLLAHQSIQPSYLATPVEESRRSGETTISGTVISAKTEVAGIATLSCQSGPQAGRTFALGSGISRIGRAGHNDVVVADDQVSRTHAEVTFDGKDFYVQDLGSKNGTYVDGTILPRGKKWKLRDGAELRLGTTRLLLQSEQGTRLAGE